jgi:hypothetical protein
MSGADVIDIEDARRVWMAGLGVCGTCGTVWGAVTHVDRQHATECPVCGEFTGAFVPDSALRLEELNVWVDEEPSRAYRGRDST